MRHVILVAVATMFFALSAASGRADPAAGARLFEAKGCAGCHYTEGPAREKSIEDQLAKTGPELWYAGSKFQSPWLKQWLAEPVPIRPLVYNSLTETNPGNHPNLSEKEAVEVAEFLMTLTSDEGKAGIITPKTNLTGRQIFIKKMPCIGCHRSPGRRGKAVQGGLSGPSLAGASQRLNPDWIYAYLSNPSVFKPFKSMPTFAGILSDKDITNVATHVANLR